VGHDTIQLVLQRAFAPFRQIQPLSVFDAVHQLPPLPTFIPRHACELDHKSLWTTMDLCLLHPVAFPLVARLRGALNTFKFHVRKFMFKTSIQRFKQLRAEPILAIGYHAGYRELHASLRSFPYISFAAVVALPSSLVLHVEQAIDGIFSVDMSAL
jgi:hypothetical protein